MDETKKAYFDRGNRGEFCIDSFGRNGKPPERD